MNEVRLPIKTYRDGNKITKVCVEDFYKVLNRVISAMDKAYNDSTDIIDSIEKEVDDYEGSLIVGTGTSEPCSGDVFDEQIGNNIAFMKCKLNANLKKFNLLRRIYKNYYEVMDKIMEEIYKIEGNIQRDVKGIRKYNPEYLKNDEV